QGLVNAGVAMGALPTKGTTLPLFSYGRSSLVVSLAAIGLVLNVARPKKPGRKGWR
ncbi:MAG: FtsW/RodA/SpoVE family cell cycle protein, partial [Deltaproteobacteria bacterium]|nr:FtsW/RodA/SpoVE family cell cycle protein [Deltaproteobacteria bacterium]